MDEEQTLPIGRARALLERLRDELWERRRDQEQTRRDALERDRPAEYVEAGARDENIGVLDEVTLRESRIIKEIDAALARIEDGTYGICEECGEPIDPRRLEAIPYTRLCVADLERLAREQAGFSGAPRM